MKIPLQLFSLILYKLYIYIYSFSMCYILSDKVLVPWMLSSMFTFVCAYVYVCSITFIRFYKKNSLCLYLNRHLYIINCTQNMHIINICFSTSEQFKSSFSCSVIVTPLFQIAAIPKTAYVCNILDNVNLSSV